MLSEPGVDAGSGATGSAVACGSCGSPTSPEEYFCEACGFQLAALPADAETPDAAPVGASIVAAPCPSCGSTEATDGWCDVCGTRLPVWRDHYRESPAPWVGGVCDRGVQHHRNEDAMASIADDEPGTFAAIVVCDGVSNATDSDIASLNAARAAVEVLGAVPSTLGAASTSPALLVQRLCQVMVDAGVAAQAEAVRVAAAAGPTDNPPSCTFAAAAVVGDVVAVGWVGDSRVYWLADDGPAEQLTVDDSWATEQVRLGMARADAEVDPRAHSITKWLGVDSPDASVVCATSPIGTDRGWLVVCSDGLWNYVSDAAALRDRIAAIGVEDPTIADNPQEIAARLVGWANEQGGHDNVTAVLARIAVASSPNASAPFPPSSSGAHTSDG